MKGRDNYLCRYRFAQFEQRALDRSSRGAPLHSGAVPLEPGDRKRRSRARSRELPDDLRLWRDINARADTCTGSKCPEYEMCWLTKVKRQAQQAQIVVVNHHLFFADLAVRSAYGAVLPDYDTVIFDEAHLLEEVATLYFGETVSANQVEELARDAGESAAKGGGPAKGGGGAAELREAARELFAPIRDALRGAVGTAALRAGLPRRARSVGRVGDPRARDRRGREAVGEPGRQRGDRNARPRP